MKAAFVQQGHPAIPDGAKAARYGIDTLFYEARDPQISAAFFDQLRGFKLRPGIMLAPDWWEKSISDPAWANLPAKTLAAKADKYLHDLGSDNKICSVMFDIEALWLRSSLYVRDVLVEWRKLRPTRQTSWTTEAYQGGGIGVECAARINSDPNLVVLPQAYAHKDPTTEELLPLLPESLVLDICQTPGRPDIDKSRIKCFYDPLHLPPVWDGCVFGFGELP